MKLRSTVLAAAALAVTAISAQAAIVINNNSFEAAALADGAFSGTIAQWTQTPAGAFIENPPNVASQFGAAEVINGSSTLAGLEYNTGIRQGLTTDGTTAYNLVLGSQFTVSLDIGRRGRSPQEAEVGSLLIEIYGAGATPSLYASFSVDVNALTAVGANNVSGNAWAVGAGQWLAQRNYALTLNPLFDATQLGTQGELRLTHTGANPSGTGQVAVDLITVAAIPEPSAALLGGLGLLGLLRRRRA